VTPELSVTVPALIETAPIVVLAVMTQLLVGVALLNWATSPLAGGPLPHPPPVQLPLCEYVLDVAPVQMQVAADAVRAFKHSRTTSKPLAEAIRGAVRVPKLRIC